MNTLQSQILIPGSKLVVHLESDIKRSLDKLEKLLGITVEYDSEGSGWIRDETFVMNDGSVLNMDRLYYPTKQCKNSIKQFGLQKYPDPRFMQHVFGLVGGNTVFGNVGLSTRYQTLQNACMEGGNMLVYGNHVFVGSESVEIFNIVKPYINILNKSDFHPYFKQLFPLHILHIVPQILYHLDMFAMLVAPNFVLLPELPSILLSRTRNGVKKRFLQNLRPLEHYWWQAKTIFENVGLKVCFIDGYFFDDNCIVALYFNGLTGFDVDHRPYVLLPRFTPHYNRTFKRMFNKICDTHIYWIGGANENRDELSQLGGSFRCQTAC